MEQVSKRIAKLLKEKDIIIPSHARYVEIESIYLDKKYETIEFGDPDFNSSTKTICFAPTHEQVMKLYREKTNHHIEVMAYPHEDGCFYWAYKVMYLDISKLCYTKECNGAGFDSYEQACEQGIEYCIYNCPIE